MAVVGDDGVLRGRTGGRRLSGARVAPPIASVLLVADETDWVRAMRSTLADEGFPPVVDPTGETAFDEERLRGFDLTVIDLDLRHQSGLAVCAAARLRTTSPIVVTARAAEEPAILAGFAAGADQFVGHDATPRQLVARFRSLLRRSGAARAGAVKTAHSRRAAAGPVVVEDGRRAARVRGEEVLLTPQEHEVLRLLLARPGRVVSRAELSRTGALVPGERSLDFVVRRLRQKLEAVEPTRRIVAVRGVGFRFDPSDPSSSDPR